MTRTGDQGTKGQRPGQDFLAVTLGALDGNVPDVCARSTCTFSLSKILWWPVVVLLPRGRVLYAPRINSSRSKYSIQ